MNNLEKVYDQRFNEHNKRLELIFIDALQYLFNYDIHQCIEEIWDDLAIIYPSSEFIEELKTIIDKKQYKEIFGKFLGGEKSIF